MVIINSSTQIDIALVMSKQKDTQYMDSGKNI